MVPTMLNWIDFNSPGENCYLKTKRPKSTHTASGPDITVRKCRLKVCERAELKFADPFGQDTRSLPLPSNVACLYPYKFCLIRIHNIHRVNGIGSDLLLSTFWQKFFIQLLGTPYKYVQSQTVRKYDASTDTISKSARYNGAFIAVQ